MAATARTVKDVSPHEFVKAYAAHLKRSGKVNIFGFNFVPFIFWVVEVFGFKMVLGNVVYFSCRVVHDGWFM